MMHLVIFGRQGAGKGTQSELLVQRYGCIHVSTGDMLRAAIANETEMGLAAKAIMDAGGLVDDDTMCGIVKQRLNENDILEHGVLLDGFPRTVAQAQALQEILGDRKIDAAINLDVPVDIVTERMLARGRADDTPEAIAKRLELYETMTQPLLEWFDEQNLLAVIDGVGTETEVATRIAEQLDGQDNGFSVATSQLRE